MFRNADLRRLQLAFAGSGIGDWAASIALAVVAFQSDGPTAVGLLLLIRMLPSAFAAPFTSLLGDRFRRTRVMLSSDLVRAAAMAGAAVAAFADAPTGVLYAVAGFVAVSGTALPARSF